jgi:CBS-domain-containing membrane protein
MMIMTRNTLAVEEEDYIFTAEQYMSERRVRYLPVVDSSGRLTGLVTYEDLLLHMTSERLERVRESHCRLSSD